MINIISLATMPSIFHAQQLSYLEYFKDTWHLFLIHSNSIKIMIVLLAKIRTSGKAEAIAPIMGDVLLFLGCLEIN